ncbi:MAG: toll/interleukin-1 receptor domain-containing protein [Anaerolineales bacterium]
MSDVFISYSRKDTEFVHELLELIEARNREAWIDLTGIEYSVKWWDEICTGIDGANSFVLIISPNSMNSVFCHREIQYAMVQKKRIIPFLIKPMDEQEMLNAWQNNPEFKNFEQMAKDNWDTIQSIQWIDYSKIGQMDKAVDVLLETVDTDPERTHMHTRLLLRMRGWELGGRNPSSILRGDELRRYEEWLEESNQSENPPKPTTEQEYYIQESRRFEDEQEAIRIKRERLVRRLRNASIVLGLFFVAAIVAIYLSVQSQKRTSALVDAGNTQVAVGHTEIASGNTQVAIIGETLTPIPPRLTSIAMTIAAGDALIESQDLGAAALSLIHKEGGNAETAALLAIRALFPGYLESADEALVEAVNRLQLPSTVFSYEFNVSGVAFSPDGKTFLIGNSAGIEWGGAELRDTESGEIIWTRDLSEPILSDVSFSPDGTQIVAAMGEYTVQLWNSATGKTIQEIHCENEFVRHAIFSPDGKNILALSRSSLSGKYTIQSFDIQTGEQIFLNETDARLIQYLPDGQSFIVGSNRYRSMDGTLIQSNFLDKDPLAISSDGKFYISRNTITADLVSIGTNQSLHTLTGHTGDVESAAFSKSDNFVITGSSDNTARVWDTASGALMLVLSGHTTPVRTIAVSPDGTKILTGADHEARLWSITSEAKQNTILTNAEIRSMALSPDGKYVLVGNSDGRTKIWDLSSGNVLRTITVKQGGTNTVAWSPVGKLIAVPKDPDVGLYDFDSGELVKTLQTPNGSSQNIEYLTFSADGQWLFANYHESIARLWDVSSGQLLREFEGVYSADGHPYLRFSPDGSLVVRAFNTSDQAWIELPSGKTILYPEAIYGDVVSFSNDSTLFAVTDGYAINVWDLGKKEIITTFSGHKDRVVSIAFSSDNSLLLTGSADKTAKLWDIASGKLLRTFNGHTAEVTNVAFMPDGKHIVTASLDGTIRVWQTDYRDLVDYACTRVGRDLTQDERIQYGINGGGATCPQFGYMLQPLQPTSTPMMTATPVQSLPPIATPTAKSP